MGYSPLKLNIHQPVMDEIENWDDEDFIVNGDELSFQSAGTYATAPTTQSQFRRRDSTSSHVSLRSDIESWTGEEKQLHLPADDESSTFDAIAAAEDAGIPLPRNVPTSALTGGTIKRLGWRKVRKIIREDWENDLEFPDVSRGLTLKPKKASDFPETLRQVSSGSSYSSPTKNTIRSGCIVDKNGNRNHAHFSPIAPSLVRNVDKIKDDDNESIHGGDTIKASKFKLLQHVSLVTPPTPRTICGELEDDYEKHLVLPSNGKLRLSTRRDIPKTPSMQSEELDWGEGSLGIRYGGTRRDGRSNRSSTASALSPSLSSSMTAESEDETFEGLVLPTGRINFRERLLHRKKSMSPERIPEEPEPEPKKTLATEADAQDFFEGLDVGNGQVFNSGKLTLHKHIKIKETRPSSPARPKTAVSLTFINKATAATRLPCLSHERAHSTSLEPVYESGGSAPPQRNRRSQSRLGHAPQSSVTSLPAPTTTSPGRLIPPSTPQRRDIGPRSSFSSLRAEASTTSAQLLKQKRSLPAVRQLNMSAKSMVNRSDRPPSRTDATRSQPLRPKTPVERPRTSIFESIVSHARRMHIPFFPAGASQLQSQHVASKTLLQLRRHDSDNITDVRPLSRPTPRSPPSPHRFGVAADTWERLSRPKNKKHFGDGHELDGFDDLPTSRDSETRFLKHPVGSGCRNTMRNKFYQHILPDRMTSPASPTRISPGKANQLPHFARETTASRIARETALAQRAPSRGSNASATSQKDTHTTHRNSHNLQTHLPQPISRSKRNAKRPQQLKPHLISNINSGKESKVVNGMFYNADTYRWEGNENALNLFDATPASTLSTTSAVQHWGREKEVTTPRPALITNISASKGIQVVGGMVFDPQNMCWLKIGPLSNVKSEASDTMDGFNALDDDEDVFKDIPDLKEKPADERDGRTSDIKDDWLVGEEFDVGPEFIRRQREEEERWCKKCKKWIGRGPRDREAWRWTIRDLVSQFDEPVCDDNIQHLP